MSNHSHQSAIQMEGQKVEDTCKKGKTAQKMAFNVIVENLPWQVQRMCSFTLTSSKNDIDFLAKTSFGSAATFGMT